MNKIPLTYGATIYLQNAADNTFVSDSGIFHKPPSTSQQNIVVASSEPGTPSAWVIMPRHNERNQPAPKTVIKNGDVIKLLNVETERNLHSHSHSQFKLTIDPELQEVTTYQSPSGGDDNDDWEVRIGGDGIWSTDEGFRLVHVNTGKWLASDKTLSNDSTLNRPAVFCQDSGDKRSVWVATTQPRNTRPGPNCTLRLAQVEISGFRSFRETQTLHVDQQVTVLIGANDHGKTNVLKALTHLNDDNHFTPEDRNWDCEDDNSQPRIKWKFDLLFPGEIADPTTVPSTETHAESDGDFGNNFRRQTAITFVRRGVGGAVEVERGLFPLSNAECDFLLSIRPKVELFRQPERINDEVTHADLALQSHEFMKGVFIKAGLWEHRDKVFAQNRRTDLILANASRQLTDTLQREWEQGKDLTWIFDHTRNGECIRLDIKDPAVAGTHIGLEHRSSGFNAFFVLSMTTFARTYFQKEKSYIYLFDEPGTYLHPIAQINLQRVFESLAEKHQLMYTTHSMFLVNKNYPSRNHVVRKGRTGTLVNSKPFANNWKAVRESLGILWAHNFLIADRTLVVEGPSDPIFLLACLNKLVQTDRHDIDLNGFSIMDGGDSANYLAMAKIMLAEGRKVTALLDGDEQASLRTRLERICAKEAATKSLVVKTLNRGRSIEDLVIKKDLYVQAVIDTLDEVLIDGLAELADGTDKATALTALKTEIINKPSDKTLGKHVEDSIRKILKNKGSISKVAVAFKYEDALSNATISDADVPTELQDLVNMLRKELQLESQKAKNEILLPETK